MQLIKGLNIVFALLRRDQKEVLPQLKDIVINATIQFLFQGITFLWLYPILGMPREMAAAIYIGTFIFLIIEIAFTRSLALVYDLRFSKFTGYIMNLPAHRNWLLLFYVLGNMMRMIFNTVPMFFFAKFLLGDVLNIGGIHWVGLLSVYILGMIFCSTLFFSVAFLASFDWYMNSFWQQLLNPLQMFGGIFFTWSSIALDFPVLHAAMRINPYTYLLEGLRLSMFDFYQSSLSISTCVIAMTVACIASSILLSYAAKRRLDMV